MTTKPTAPPGRNPTPDATSIIKDIVANDADQLNADATEFNDGEYGGTNNTTSENININAKKEDVTVAEDKTPTKAPAPIERITVDPQTVSYTADGRVVQLPMPNELRKYASYNYKIGMYALTNDEINNPDETYRIKRPSIAIMQSGGGLGDSKVLTAYETSGKKIEFFCNNLEIESLIAPSRRKGTTNAVGFRLEILEPYSMGLFLQTLQLAAYQAGHQNYLEAPFLLTLDFVGFDNDGVPTATPIASKLLPFKLVGSELEVTAGGSSYVVEGVAYNEGALKDQTQCIPCDVNLTGRTIEELLQSSPKSLSSELNKYFGQKAVDGTITTADQYFVVFPKKRATKGNMSGVSSDGGAGATDQSGSNSRINVSSGSSQRKQASVEELQELYRKIKGGQPPFGQDLLKEYIEQAKALVSTSALGQEITDKQTGAENSNEIGTSKMFRLEELGSTSQPFGDANFTWDKDKEIWTRDNGQLQIDPGLGEIKFVQGTRIQDIVEELIILSDYGRETLFKDSDTNGMKNWFKIDTQVFNITDPETEKKTGQPPRIYVFRILPYKVHEAKFISPDKIPYGIEALKKQICKQYDYIYSGKNDDIINFNINLDNTFFKSISPGITPGLNTEEGSKEGENPEEKVIQKDADNDQAINGKTAAVLENESRAAGAVNLDDKRIDIARRFNQAIVDSNVDQITIEMEIWGDPYYISDSGVGNFNSENTELINIDSDGNIDYQYGEVDIQLNFRTPVDYKENGIMGFPEETVEVDAFSGLYMVTTVKNVLAGGEFKQTLECVRRSNQYPKKPVGQDDKTSQEVVPKKADKNSEAQQNADDAGVGAVFNSTTEATLT